MGLRFDTSTFFESSGSAAAVFSEKLRDGVVTFACGLWQNYPDFITQGTNPGSSWARGYMNTVCSSIQPPVPPPTVPFTGGQCCDTQYRVDIAYTFIRCFNGNIEATGTPNFTVTGKVNGLRFREDPSIPGQWYLELVYEDCAGTEFTVLAFSTTRCIRFGGCFTTDTSSPDFDCIDIDASTWAITGITRTGGAPDTCGDPPPRYESPEPTSDDLRDTINIDINDGLDLELEIVYNKYENNYNFPIFFKVNGVNVSLDLGGLNFYGSGGGGDPSGGNDSPPPGSDGGDDGAGGSNTTIYDDNEYPVADDIYVPHFVSQTIEYLICSEGVIDAISETVKLGTGYSPLILIIIEILKSIVEDVCTPEAPTVGLPEYYFLKPGTERPAIVYIWKELVNDTWQPTTFSSTVTHPSSSAIEEIPNLESFSKRIGKYRQQLTLVDGSRIIATGLDESEADANFQFLLSRVNSVFIPANAGVATTRGFDDRLTNREIFLRQIEYYPFGKAANIAPEIKRLLDPPD